MDVLTIGSVTYSNKMLLTFLVGGVAGKITHPLVVSMATGECGNSD